MPGAQQDAELGLGAPGVIKPDFSRRERFECKADGAQKPERIPTYVGKDFEYRPIPA